MIYFFGGGGLLGSASNLYFQGKKGPPVASGSAAATVKGRRANIPTPPLYLKKKKKKKRCITNTKPTTLRGWCSHKMKLSSAVLSHHRRLHLPLHPSFTPSSCSSSHFARPTDTLKFLKYRHKSQPVKTHRRHFPHLEKRNGNASAYKRERNEDRGSGVSQLQVVSRCGGSGDGPLWRC